MFGQVIPRSFLWLVTLCAVLIIGITGCGGDEADDDNDWVGTWEIDTIDGQSLEQVLAEDLEEESINFSIVTNNWTFNSDETMDAEFAVKLEVKEGDTEFSVQSSVKVMGTYSLSGSNYTLTITTEGEATTFFGGADEDTGTWSRTGDTLTINSDDGNTIVFKKK